MSTIRSFLVQLDAAPSSAARLEFARSLALRNEAILSAMFVAAPPQRTVQMAFSESPAALLQPVDRAIAERARNRFADTLAAGGPAMRWLETGDADPVAMFRRHALYADLLVLGQRDAVAAPGTHPPDGFVESVLIATGKPALIVPLAGDHEGPRKSVLVGWNATPHAARAVVAALPWLRAARRVHVLQAIDDQASSDELGIEQYLKAHGIAPVLHRHEVSMADAGNALLSFARDVEADLLVMGCYGHSRARELVLGGASRTVLHGMPLPVLMAH
jgi:nucleotide-binding universal stress UspA family protein